MLVLTSKKYEVEETIKATKIKDGMEQEYQKLIDEHKEEEAEKLLDTLYEFQMQITPDEMKELRDILFDEKSMNLAKKLSREKDLEKRDIIEEEINKRAYEIQDRFIDICFKEHQKPYIEKCGEGRFLGMIDIMYGFFTKAFIDKRANQVNTISTNLKRIGNN